MTGDLAINMWSNLFALYFNKQTVEEFKRESPYELVKKRQVFIRGWIGYFRAAGVKRTMMSLDEWLRRRFRMYIWILYYPELLRVFALMRLNRRVPVGTHGGVRDRLPGLESLPLDCSNRAYPKKLTESIRKRYAGVI